MKSNNIYDLIIIGGGLAGLTLARQLLLEKPSLKILIAERRTEKAPEAAFKVGESTVEIGSHYLAETLKLKTYLSQAQLPKAGLRFFFSQENNQHIDRRIEFGGVALPPAASYQLDRGRFENDLCEKIINAGAQYLAGAQVTQVNLDKTQHHTLILKHAGETHTYHARWVVDTSGRFSVLKRQLNLKQTVEHNINAAWFRLQTEIDIDNWSNQCEWNTRVPPGIRRLSTNHLMGKGYWVWIIPLASGSTSIGIVADNQQHPYCNIASFEAALHWLEQHEPQCANIIKQSLDKKQDFHALKHFSHACQQLYSAERWCISGEAGVFLDPFYSPGTDFIAISNDFICDLILREIKGEDIQRRSFYHNHLYLELFYSFLTIYQQQYPIMGHSQAMLAKITWDYAAYWAISCPLYINHKFCDLDFMNSITTIMRKLNKLNQSMQLFFRSYAKTYDDNIPAYFIDPLSLSFLKNLNQALTKPTETSALKKQLENNLLLLEALAETIYQETKDQNNIIFEDAYLNTLNTENNNHKLKQSIQTEIEKLFRSSITEAV